MVDKKRREDLSRHGNCGYHKRSCRESNAGQCRQPYQLERVLCGLKQSHRRPARGRLGETCDHEISKSGRGRELDLLMLELFHAKAPTTAFDHPAIEA